MHKKGINRKIQDILCRTPLEKAGKETICQYCPCRDHCALWLFDAWNVNFPMCQCMDERLVWLESPFAVDQDLLDEWKRFHSDRS